jgi:hypothetical protein
VWCAVCNHAKRFMTVQFLRRDRGRSNKNAFTSFE